jgi:hypothetical protein
VTGGRVTVGLLDVAGRLVLLVFDGAVAAVVAVAGRVVVVEISFSSEIKVNYCWALG